MTEKMFISVREAASELSDAEYTERLAKQRVKEAKEQLLKAHLKIEAVRTLELLGVAPDVVNSFYEYDMVSVYQVDTGKFKRPSREQDERIRSVGNNGLTPVYFVLEQQFFVLATGKMELRTAYLRLGSNLNTIRLARYIPEHYPSNCVHAIVTIPNEVGFSGDFIVEKTPSGGLKIIR